MTYLSLKLVPLVEPSPFEFTELSTSGLNQSVPFRRLASPTLRSLSSQPRKPRE
jgi:hypothetical protein